eukprot:366654_1
MDGSLSMQWTTVKSKEILDQVTDNVFLNDSDCTDNYDTASSTPQHVPTASVLSSIANLCNSLVGAGILGLPYAVTKIGWFSSIILLIVCAATCAFTFQLQASTAIKYNNSTKSLSSSYFNLSNITVPKLQLIANLSVSLSTFCASCTYLIIIGDLMPQIITFIFPNMSHETAIVFKQRRFWISIFLAIVIIPVTFKRKLNALRYTSSIAIICFIYIIIMMIIFLNDSNVNKCIHSNDCGIIPSSNLNSVENIFAFFKAIPFYLTAFAAHPLSFSVANELSNSTFSRMNYVVIATYIVTSILYSSSALLGYFTFGNFLNSNVLTNYPQHNVLVLLARIGLTFAVAFSYPVVMNPGRHCLSSMFYKKNASEISKKRFIIVTSLWNCAAFIVTMIVSDLGIILAFLGSTGGNMGALILPGLYYYYYNDNHSTSYNNKTKCCATINKYGSIISVTIGILLIPFCLTMMFL